MKRLTTALSNVKSIIYGIDRSTFDAMFTALLLAFTLVLLGDTPQYSEETMVFPLVIGIPAALMLSVLLVVQSSERARELAEHVIELFSSESRFATKPDGLPSDGDHVDQRMHRARALRTTAWVLILLGLITVFGFLVSIFVFLLLYFRRYASQEYREAILYTVVTWTFVYVLFVAVLDTRFYMGVLWNLFV